MRRQTLVVHLVVAVVVLAAAVASYAATPAETLDPDDFSAYTVASMSFAVEMEPLDPSTREPVANATRADVFFEPPRRVHLAFAATSLLLPLVSLGAENETVDTQVDELNTTGASGPRFAPLAADPGTCALGQYWDGSRCRAGGQTCPSGQIFNYYQGKCVTKPSSGGSSGGGSGSTSRPDPGNCPLGTYWTGAECKRGSRGCPQGQIFNYYEARCVPEPSGRPDPGNCPLGKYWDGRSCRTGNQRCPSGQIFNYYQSRCVTDPSAARPTTPTPTTRPTTPTPTTRPTTPTPTPPATPTPVVPQPGLWRVTIPVQVSVAAKNIAEDIKIRLVVKSSLEPTAKIADLVVPARGGAVSSRDIVFSPVAEADLRSATWSVSATAAARDVSGVVVTSSEARTTFTFSGPNTVHATRLSVVGEGAGIDAGTRGFEFILRPAGVGP